MDAVNLHWRPRCAEDGWVLLLSVLVALPYLVYLPTAIAVLCGLAWSLDLLLIGRGIRLAQGVKFGLVLVGLAALWVGVGRSGEVELWLAPFCLALALKPLETHDQRARRSFVLLCYLGALIFFFRESNDLWLLYYLFYLVVLTGFLLRIELPQTGPMLALKNAFVLLAQALPLALVLFYLFPRLEEPLWQWSGEAETALTGIPDEVELNTLSSLAESAERAFEVLFETGPPAIPDLYWRGPVYYFTDGRVWDSNYYPVRPMAPERLDTDSVAALTALAEETISYQIRQTSGSSHWLVALDLPITETHQGWLSADYQLVPRRSGGDRRFYRITSALSILTPPDSESTYGKALQLPRNSRMAREARAMGEKLKAEYADDPEAARKIIQRILTFFAEAPFIYSYEVPEYVTNPIDDFLFDGRRGYCTHYAAATTLVLRAAEVPARMIMGYRGGEWEPGRGVLIVRQKHAHAWVEAWTSTDGWLRVDPTAVIPAERVLTQNIASGQPSAFNERALARRGAMEGLRRFQRSSPALGAGDRVTSEQDGEEDAWASSTSGLAFAYIAETAEFLWSAWLKDFDYQQQRQLMDACGGQLALFGLALVLLTALLLLGVGLALLRIQPRRSDPGRCVQVLYRQLCKRLAAAGIELRPHEPHQSLESRLISIGRFDPEQLSEVFATYERLRYGQHEHEADKEALRRLRKQIRGLRISALRLR